MARKLALSVTLPEDIREMIDNIAHQKTIELRLKGEVKTVYAGDIAREAIQEYLQNHGYPDAKIEIDRGGNRRANKDVS